MGSLVGECSAPPAYWGYWEALCSGLLWVELCPRQIRMVEPEPRGLQKVTLCGNRPYRGERVTASHTGWALAPVTGALTGGEVRTETLREDGPLQMGRGAPASEPPAWSAGPPG